MRRSRVAVAILVIAAESPPAVAADVMVGAEPVRLDVTSTTNAGWHTQVAGSTPRPAYGELFERLNAGLTTGPWLLNVRLDTSSFLSAPRDAQDHYTAEKVWAGWTGRSWELGIGDAYVSFGRGLALSLRKIDELGVDTTLRGTKLLVHRGDFEGTLVAGFTNIQNVDEASGSSVHDPNDVIAGAQTRFRVGPLTTGAHAVVVAFNDTVGPIETRPFRDRYYQLGTTLDAPRLSNDFGFYLESIAQFRDTEAGVAQNAGVGAYGSAVVYSGAATLLFEGKAYGDLEPIKPNLIRPEFASVAYNSPPTLERVAQILENPQQRIYGGRTRVDWAWSERLMVYGNYGLFRDDFGYTNPADVAERRPGTIHDPYAGAEGRWDAGRSHIFLSGGARLVTLSGSNELVRSDLHGELDASQVLAENTSVEVHGLHLARRKYLSQLLNEKFHEGSLLLALRHRRIWLAAGYDYTTEPVQPKRDYFNATLQWEVTPSSNIRIFAGAARGGLKCMSGVCRTVPPFEGVKLSATLRY